MKTLSLVLLLALFSNSLYAIDCKIYMEKPDQVSILKQKSCYITHDRYHTDFDTTDVCLAKMKTANGIEILRLVVEGKHLDRPNDRPVILVTESRTDKLKEMGDDLFFSRTYSVSDSPWLKKMDVTVSKDFAFVTLVVSEGLIFVKPKYNIDLDCI